MRVALVHDYLTQRGGAERVVLSMRKAFPDAPLHTSLYWPEGTFDEFAHTEIRTLPLQRIPPLRRWHRAALPLLAPAFARLRVDADVTFCSTSGWAHGTQVAGRKVVYCHTPARWLYQPARYLGDGVSAGRAALSLLRRPLERWDRRAAASAHRYLANSRVVRDRIRAIYGIDAEVVPPPHAIDVDAPHTRVDGLDPGFVLCVSRLLPYKNIGAIENAFRALPDAQLVVAGTGPDEERLRAGAPANVRYLGLVSDAELRWLYANARALVAASYEDYGITPLEAAAFGRPTAALRWGGFLDTVVEDLNGRFFDVLEPTALAAALRGLLEQEWDADAIRTHADRFSERRFVDRLRAIADDEARA